MEAHADAAMHAASPDDVDAAAPAADAASLSGTKRRRRSKHLARAARRRRVGSAEGDAGALPSWRARADSGVGSGAGATDEGVPEATANFEAYYTAQRLFASHAEWEAFRAALRRPLPVSFRMSLSSPYRQQCLDAGTKYLTSQRTFRSGRDVVEPPTRLAWANAWQLGCSSLTLRAATEPHLQGLRKWVARYAALGALTRQEVVSMIPVAFLDVQPGHHVLDMCAAPGSKTTQVLDVLQRMAAGAGAGACAGAHGGMVVANDLDPGRGYMLVRRCTAMGAACARLVVTQHKAQKFPDVSLHRTATGAGASAKPGTAPTPHECAGVYDRIVCDVPCCGDGTLRKSPSLWSRWHPEFAVGLHSLQVQIAMRGASLLRVGGRMVYSTCTFNPVENEAVVSEILRRCGGALELVDASATHPELLRSPGIRRWCVMDDAMTRYDTFEQTQLPSIPAAHRRRFRRSMFPTPLGAAAGTVSGRLPPLRRCMRFYPHAQDTGGFFVAVLHKKRPLPPGVRPQSPPPEVGLGAGGCRRSVAAAAAVPVAPIFRFLPPANGALAWLREHLGLRKSAVKALVPCLYSRTSAEGGAVYYVAPELRTQGYLPVLDDDATSPKRTGSHAAVRVVSAGTKVLTAHRRHGTWLLTQAGARLLGHQARRQVLHLSPADVAPLLQVPVGNSRTVRGLRHAVPIARLPPSARAAVDKAQLQHGGLIVTCDVPASGSTGEQRLMLPARLMWREPRVAATGARRRGRPTTLHSSQRVLALALTLHHPRGLEQLPHALAAAARMKLNARR